jgi:DMSO/TMAO reductase YedYZ molybdopterin-dependent catalytic subunit
VAGPRPRITARTLAGALAGLLSAAVALGVGELVAAMVRPAAAPIIVVGNRIVLATPESVKRWAIRSFGTHDKTALFTGIFVVAGVAAAVVGALAVRRLGYGYAGIALFALVGCYCALTTTAHQGGDVVPTLVGAAAAVLVLRELVATIGVPSVAEEPGAPGLDDPLERAANDPDTSGQAGVPRRRSFLVGVVMSAALAAAAGFGGRALQTARFSVEQARKRVRLPPVADPAAALPTGTDLRVSPVPWATSNADFYRIDTQLVVPQVDPDTWRLRIHGMVDHDVTLDYQQLLALPMVERWITLCCVSNEIGGPLIGTARFVGARLPDVLRSAGLQRGADQLLMTGVEGTTIGAPTTVVMDGRDALIAVGMNGEPLPTEHGFPARIVVPGLYGYVSACKWVVDIEATTFATKAYWVQGGWAQQTDIKLMSRIDTPSGGQVLHVGQPAVLAGVAWDQHVGISRVQVQVDERSWLTARLAAVPSADTWRQWTLSWTPTAADAGHHLLRVRAFDARGRVQMSERHDVFPAGATGLHTVSITVR